MSIDILVVDDEKDIRLLIKGILEDEGYAVREANGEKEAFAEVNSKKPDLIILDIWLQGSGKDGLEILDSIKTEYPLLPILMISGHGTIETAVSAIKAGAYDFIEKPFKSDRLILMIKRALEAAKLKKENENLKAKVQAPDQFLGTSANAVSIQQTIEKVAPTNSRILISGEAGTGKNVIGRALHKLSKRSDLVFESMNCSSLTPDEFEDILFGTGGESGHQGLFEYSNNGTLFVDEIGDMPMDIQKKFVRVLQEGSFKRPNTANEIKIDVRIIATTSRDLEECIQKGTFREDLYYRLNVVPIDIEPLRNRPQDIPALIKFFINQCAVQSDLKPCQLSEQTIATLQGGEWPGNARQLRNTIEWLLIMNNGSDSIIEPSQLPESVRGSEQAPISDHKAANDFISMPLKEAREEFERNYIASQLKRFGGNISQTAQFVGMERSALHRKMKSLDISPSTKQDDEGQESKIIQEA